VRCGTRTARHVLFRVIGEVGVLCAAFVDRGQVGASWHLLKYRWIWSTKQSASSSGPDLHPRVRSVGDPPGAPPTTGRLRRSMDRSDLAVRPRGLSNPHRARCPPSNHGRHLLPFRLGTRQGSRLGQPTVKSYSSEPHRHAERRVGSGRYVDLDGLARRWRERRRAVIALRRSPVAASRSSHHDVQRSNC